MVPWVLAIHRGGGKSQSVEWSEPRFTVGTDVADGVFTIQGDGILPRHLRVELGEESVTLEPLSIAKLTEVQGISISTTTTADYPVRIRIGSVEMLIDRVSAMYETSTTFDSIEVGKPQERISERACDSPLLIVKESVSAAKTIESTMSFSVEMDAAPMEDSVQVHKTYALKKEIARGGMGRIFLAEDPNLGRQVAVKISHTLDANENSAFYREAKILAHLSHPNIVPIHNFGEDSRGRPFYSMNLVGGQTLQQVLKRLRSKDAVTTLDFSLQRLLGIFRRVCHAIEFAHSTGYLHRDLKPDNIMIGEYGEVLVMDWGLAKPLRHTPQQRGGRISEEDEKRGLEGTPQYMSPEQASLDQLDERSDIYSLGAILYAILTLRAPVQGKTLEEVLNKVLSGDILPLEAPSFKPATPGLYGARKLRVPTALEAITRKAMHLNRSNRYKHVADLIRDIEAYQGGFPTNAEKASALRHLGLLVRRHRSLTAVLLLSFLGAAISTVRLARSESIARAYALRAEENALRAEKNAITAREQERAAVEAHRISRVSTANAMMASASFAEAELDLKSMRQALNNVEPDFRSQRWEYLDQRLDRADLNIIAPHETTFKSVINSRDKKPELIVLLSDGSIQSVNCISGEFTMLGKIELKSVPSWSSATPAFAASSGASNIAFIGNLEASKDDANCQLEIINLPSGALSLELPLKLSQNFLKRYQIQFDPAYQLLLLSSQNDPTILLVDVINKRIKWTHSAPEINYTTFVGSSPDAPLSVRVYSSKQIIDLNPATKAVRQTLSASEKTVFPPPRKIIPENVAGGYFATSAYGWIHFEPHGSQVTQSTGVPLGASDIAYNSPLNTIITTSPQKGGYGVIQFWNASSGELLRSEMIAINKRPSKDWILATQSDSHRVALISGSIMKVWFLGDPAYVRSIRSEKCKEGMDGSNFAFFDQPWHAFQVIRESTGSRMDGIDLRKGEEVDVENGSAAAPPVSSVPSASINGCFFASLDTTTHRITIYESNHSRFTPVHQFENCENMPSQCPSPDGNSVWRSQHFFTALNKQNFIRLDRERFAAEDLSRASTAWVGNKHVVEIVTPVAPNENDTGTQRMLVLWSIDQAKCLSETPAPDAYAVCASPDGHQIAEAGEDLKVRIRNGSTLSIERELRIHDGPIRCIAWNPKLPFLATTSSDHTLKIWDLRTDKQIAYYSLMTGIPDKICWSPDGSALALAFPDENKHLVKIFLPSVCRQQP